MVGEHEAGAGGVQGKGGERPRGGLKVVVLDGGEVDLGTLTASEDVKG